MEAFSSFITSLENWIWGAPMLILLCGTHIFMTLRTGFIQKKTFTGIRLSVTKDPDSPGDVSQFQALTTALASTIGTGNIIGVGTAIYLGGPGAVLWCWLTGVFGIATKYAESLIAVKYRVKTADGRMMGGAMYALERGLKWKKFGKVMAVLFALFAMLASFGIGCGTQINAIAEVMETNLPIGIPRIVIGIVFGIVTAIIILGITCALIFVAHPKTAPFVLTAGIGLPVGIVGVRGYVSSLGASGNFRFNRVLAWIDPEKYSDGGGYQVLQGLYAIGSGGLFGKGLGNSTQKIQSIPEAQNDMIFSIICEELGLVGAGILIGVFLILIWRFFVIAAKAEDLTGALIATGAMAHMMIQIILNIAVVTNSIPNTGITLPFISYGGTSVVFLLLEMGLVLSVSGYSGRNQKKEMRPENGAGER